MIEVKIDIGSNLSIFLVKTLLGPRPLRYSGRDFIKVLFNPPEISPIYQCFYKSTGLHIKANIMHEEDITATDTGGVWTPCDGIVIEDKLKLVEEYSNVKQNVLYYLKSKWKNSSTYISKVDYFGREFARENWELPTGREDNRNAKWFDPCDKESNKNATICRFGNCNLILISYLLSNVGSIFWESEEGTYMKTLCNINNIVPYGPDIPVGVATDYLTIDMFIGTALSYNYIDIEPYITLRNTYGLFDLRNCIINHPSIGPSIFQPIVKAHCQSPKASQLKEVYISLEGKPEKSDSGHVVDLERDKGQIVEVEGLMEEEKVEGLMEEEKVEGVMEEESNIQLPPRFQEECDKLDIQTIKNVADQLGVDMLDKRGRVVNRKILCLRIMKVLVVTN